MTRRMRKYEFFGIRFDILIYGSALVCRISVLYRQHYRKIRFRTVGINSFTSFSVGLSRGSVLCPRRSRVLQIDEYSYKNKSDNVGESVIRKATPRF